MATEDKGRDGDGEQSYVEESARGFSATAD